MAFHSDALLWIAQIGRFLCGTRFRGRHVGIRSQLRKLLVAIVFVACPCSSYQRDVLLPPGYDEKGLCCFKSETQSNKHSSAFCSGLDAIQIVMVPFVWFVIPLQFPCSLSLALLGSCLAFCAAITQTLKAIDCAGTRK